MLHLTPTPISAPMHASHTPTRSRPRSACSTCPALTSVDPKIVLCACLAAAILMGLHINPQLAKAIRLANNGFCGGEFAAA